MYYSEVGFEDIEAKILAGEKLTSDEVEDMFWEYPTVHEEEGEHYRWFYPLYKVFQIGERYFQLEAMMGLTEMQDNEYEPQVAVEVRPQEKVITITEWVTVE
jgi:hypothetical protein